MISSKNRNLKLLLVILCGSFLACTDQHTNQEETTVTTSSYITVLGIAQDGGFPHINNPAEFEGVGSGEINEELVVSLGLVDTQEKKHFLFEATPDLPEQLDLLRREHSGSKNIVDGIFLTHAHIGHYTGLMFLGREAMDARSILVYAMPRMQHFLENNGPWSQLISLNNIKINSLKADSIILLTSNLKITPFVVPHRDEFSETVGYRIDGPNKSVVFIPDIDKWEKWDRSLVELVASVDYAFLDASFFADGEIPRPMAEIPHPFIEETVSLFAKADTKTKSKIIFIHFNHSNPALDLANEQRKLLEEQGFRFAKQGDRFFL